MRPVVPITMACLLIGSAAFAAGAPPPPTPAAQASASPVPSTAVQISPTPSNPFASPAASAAPAAGANGYAALFYDFASASGGTYVPAGSTAAPLAFPSSSGHGFSVDVTGRLSRVFLGSLRIQDDSIHGADNPISTVTEGALLFGPEGSRASYGLAYISLQRSSGLASATGGGIGAALAPDDTQAVSLFGKFFVYPSLQFPAVGSAPGLGTSRSGLITYEAGVAFAPPARGGFFFSLALAGHSGAPSAYSPQTLNALQLGIGTRF